MDDIPTILEQAQGKKTLIQFAKELGVSHSILSLIKSKKRRAGGKVLRALIRHPDTKEKTLLFLSQKVTSESSSLSDVTQ